MIICTRKERNFIKFYKNNKDACIKKDYTSKLYVTRSSIIYHEIRYKMYNILRRRVYPHTIGLFKNLSRINI